jgi:hypothetical protein
MRLLTLTRRLLGTCFPTGRFAFSTSHDVSLFPMEALLMAVEMRVKNSVEGWCWESERICEVWLPRGVDVLKRVIIPAKSAREKEGFEVSANQVWARDAS